MGLPSKAKGETYYCFDYGDSRPNFYKNIFEGDAFFNPLNRCEYSGYNKIIEIPAHVFNKLSLLNDDYNKVLKDNNDFRGFFGTKDWDKSKEHLQQFYSKVWRVFDESKSEIDEHNRNRVQIVKQEKIDQDDKRKQEASARLKQTLIELEKIYSDKCKNLTRGSDQYKNCLLEQDKIVKQTEAKKLLAKQEEERRILNAELVKKKELENKLQEEKIKISKMAPDDRRAYTCSDKFGFRKGSDKFKDCVFKIYAAEIEMEKLELQRDLARANAETARLRAEAARASDDRQERLLQAQTETAKMQALAARQQAIAANTAESLALMESGLRMMSPQQSAPRMQTTCTYVGRFLNCY